MRTTIVYVLAAFAEIGGCFSFWVWLRSHHSGWWVAPGMLSLAVFAYLLTLVDSAVAGRAYAAYGSVYITASLAWLWAVEKTPPDRWDFLGASIALIGAAVIVFGPRTL